MIILIKKDKTYNNINEQKNIFKGEKDKIEGEQYNNILKGDKDKIGETG